MGKVPRKKKTVYKVSDAEIGTSADKAKGIVSRTSTLIPIIVILLIALAVYFTALFNGFVYDDRTQVLENQWIKSVSHIPEIFTKSVWSFKSEITTSNYYRPMMHLIYLVDYYLFGLAPWGFHLVNVLLHAGVSVLVFLLTLNLLRTHKSSDSTAYVLPSFIA